MRAILAIIGLWLALTFPALAGTQFGAMCQSTTYSGGITACVQLVGATLQRISAPVSIPFIDSGGNVFFVNSNATSGATTIFVNGAGTAVQGTITSPVLPGGTTFTITGGHFNLSQAITANVWTNNQMLATATASQAAGVSVALQLFNACTAAVTGSCAITSDSDFASELTYTLANFAATGVNLVGFGCENEVDGNFGFTFTVAQYLDELHVCIATGHSLGYKVWGSGYTTLGLSDFYWGHSFYSITPPALYCASQSPCVNGLTLNTLANQQLADNFTNYAYLKAPGQINFGASLPTSCATTGTGPGGGISSVQAAHLQKIEQLIYDDITNGIDYENVHWYQNPPEGFVPAVQMLSAMTGGKPAVLGEVGTFSQDPVRMLQNVNAVVFVLNAPWLVYWNFDSGNGGGTGLAIALINASNGTLRPTGVAFNSFAAAPAALTEGFIPATPCSP